MTAGQPRSPPRRSTPPRPSRLPAEAVLERLGTCPEGLTSADAADRLRTFGANVLLTHRVTALGVLVRQLRNPLLFLLLGAAVVSGLTGDPADAVIIAAIVVLSVGLGFVNEYRSERAAVAALHGNIRHQTLVCATACSGASTSRELVPGDVVALRHRRRRAGRPPAARRPTQLECDEAVLTGESMPAASRPMPRARRLGRSTCPSCAFMGTSCIRLGPRRGRATGSATAFGRIAVGLGERQAETAFQVGLRSFSRLLVRVAGSPDHRRSSSSTSRCRGRSSTPLLFSLAIAIGITPQLLPAIVSVSLSTGSRAAGRAARCWSSAW